MIALVLAAALTCNCTPIARTSNGLTACGLPDGDFLSEVRICNAGEERMFIGAVHRVKVEARPDDHLRVVEYTSWPFGEHWKWKDVPVFEYDVSAEETRTKVVLPRPAASKSERQAFLDHYLALLARRSPPHVDDVVVGKLFALAASGDQKARGLFEVMKRDTHIDGDALETWNMGMEQIAKMPHCFGLQVIDETRIFNCRTNETILDFDGTETVTIARRGDTLHVVQSAKWPFGPHWKWIDVDMFEWTIDESTLPDPHPKVIMPKPKATPAEIQKMIENYRNHRGDKEEFIGRMFTAAIAGNAEARKLFRAMDKADHLDGAYGEEWLYADAYLDLAGVP